VKLLIKLGADPDQTDQYAYTALHEAASVGYHDIVEVLIDARVDINARDMNGFTAMGYAMRSGNQDIVELLQGVGGTR
jgi:ankyrin repeat protein